MHIHVPQKTAKYLNVTQTFSRKVFLFNWSWARFNFWKSNNSIKSLKKLLKIDTTWGQNSQVVRFYFFRPHFEIHVYICTMSLFCPASLLVLGNITIVAVEEHSRGLVIRPPFIMLADSASFSESNWACLSVCLLVWWLFIYSFFHPINPFFCYILMPSFGLTTNHIGNGLNQATFSTTYFYLFFYIQNDFFTMRIFLFLKLLSAVIF